MKHYHKYHYIALLLILFGIGEVKAQENYQWLVNAIDSNNTALSAYQKSGDAQKMQNKTGLTLPNPQIGANYLRLKPRLKNQRFDYNISQSFEFPTVYGRRKSVSNQQIELVDTDIKVYRANLINQAINTYLLWVYYSELGEVLERQKNYAENIASSYQKAFEMGGVNILDRNKAKVNSVNAKKEFEINTVELNTVYQELIRYNRGKPFEDISPQFPDSDQGFFTALTEQDRFINSNSELESISQQIELSETREKLTRAERLPEFSIGFMQEQDIEVDFRGITFGMTIPLWQKKNTTKATKLSTQALIGMEENTREQYVMSIDALQKRVSELYNIMNELESTISETRGLELLKKALDLKEIIILEYLVEQSMYFELTQKYLESKLSYHIALAELYKWNY